MGIHGFVDLFASCHNCLRLRLSHSGSKVRIRVEILHIQLKSGEKRGNETYWDDLINSTLSEMSVRVLVPVSFFFESITELCFDSGNWEVGTTFSTKPLLIYLEEGPH